MLQAGYLEDLQSDNAYFWNFESRESLEELVPTLQPRNDKLIM